jgi:uncharacterized protein (TIGR03083 family)
VEDVPPIDRAEAATLATQENDRTVELLASLGPDDWSRPTDCTGWTVRDLAGHLVGAMEGFSSYGRLVRMLARSGREARGGVSFVDAMTAIQVRDRASSSTDELVARARAAAPASARFRTRFPAALRKATTKQELLDGTTERWTLAYLLDTILTRDTWMHRVDLCRAIDRPVELTAEHDGRIVADVVAEWARRHGRPFTLDLDGPAGGTYVQGEGGDHLRLDAVELCRTLSGRAPGDGLLTQEVPF